MQIRKHLNALQHIMKGQQQLFQCRVRQLCDDFTFWRIRAGNEYIAFKARQVTEIFRSLLEAFVFLQPSHKFSARIGFFLFFRLWPRQQHARFDLGQHRCHEQILARQLELQLVHHFDVLHVLFRDFGDGDIENVDVLVANQVQKQVQRALESLEEDLQRVRRYIQVLRKRRDRLTGHNSERHLFLRWGLFFVLRWFGGVFGCQNCQFGLHAGSSVMHCVLRRICAHSIRYFGIR